MSRGRPRGRPNPFFMAWSGSRYEWLGAMGVPRPCPEEHDQDAREAVETHLCESGVRVEDGDGWYAELMVSARRMR